MRAEATRQAKPLPSGVEIDAVGEALGFTRDESRELAVEMQELGWCRLNFSPDKPLLFMTIPGRNAIAKLHWPRWKRWIDQHPVFVSATISSTVALASNILLEVVKWLAR